MRNSYVSDYIKTKNKYFCFGLIYNELIKWILDHIQNLKAQTSLKIQ